MMWTVLALCLAAITSASPTPPSAAWPPSSSPSNGCGTQHPTGWNNDTSVNSIQSGNYTRTWGVWLPDSYNSNASKEWPVIFDYHGSGGTGWTQYLNSMYYGYAKAQEYVIIYPQGVGGHWSGPNYSDPHVNDLSFTTNLLNHIESTYRIDTNRVYASGKSNGAGFVDTLACADNGDDFAAFAMASAALYTDLNSYSCSKKRAILESHGNEDVTIPYIPVKDGSGGPLPSIPDWVSWWGRRNCGSYTWPAATSNLGGYNTTKYSCNGYEDVVSHYQIFSIGHCWPSAAENNNDALRNGSVDAHCLDVAQPLDFTPVVLDFFGNWTLRTAPGNGYRPFRLPFEIPFLGSWGRSKPSKGS